MENVISLQDFKQKKNNVWRQKVSDLTIEGINHALQMSDMELRDFMGLKGSSECPKIRILLKKELDKRTGA